MKMPFPIRLGLLSLMRYKRVGFSFDNLQFFICYNEELHFEKPKDIADYKRLNGEASLCLELFWAAHRSYCYHNKKKTVCNKKRFFKAIGATSKDDLSKLYASMRKAESYGMKQVPKMPEANKKKVTKKAT